MESYGHRHTHPRQYNVIDFKALLKVHVSVQKDRPIFEDHFSHLLSDSFRRILMEWAADNSCALLIFRFRYNATYKKQLDLDNQMGAFIRNLKKVLLGVNVVRNQLSHRLHQHPHVLALPYCEGDEEDEVRCKSRQFLPRPVILE